MKCKQITLNITYIKLENSRVTSDYFIYIMTDKPLRDLDQLVNYYENYIKCLQKLIIM